MGTLATLTTSGRAAIAAAIAACPIHLAWGTGEEAWDTVDDKDLPGLVERTSLFAEVGRRKVSATGFCLPDDEGGIIVPVGLLPDGTIETARYRQVTEATPYIYIRTNYDFADAPNVIIREVAVMLNTKVNPDLPPGQLYFRPDEIAEPGQMLTMQIMRPVIARSPARRESIEFVLPI